MKKTPAIDSTKTHQRAASARWEDEWARHGQEVPKTDPGSQGLGARLRWARARRRLSSEDLARELGITKATLLAYETSRSIPRCDQVEAAARALEVSCAWLLIGTGKSIQKESWL